MHSSTLFTAISLLFFAASSVYADEQSMLALVNAARSKAGKGPLCLNGNLDNAASKQSQYQQKTGTMSHDGQGGSSPGDRVKEAGVNWQSVAENVAVGYQSEQALMEGWMQSPGHKANILGDYTMFGFSQSGDYATQTFAKGGGSCGTGTGKASVATPETGSPDEGSSSGKGSKRSMPPRRRDTSHQGNRGDRQDDGHGRGQRDQGARGGDRRGESRGHRGYGGKQQS